MATSTVPAVFNALTDLLAARPNLVGAGVTVRSGPVGPEDDAPNAIVLTSTEDESQEPLIGGRRRTERYVVLGVLRASAYGLGESAIREARDRAYGFQAEIEAALVADPHLGGLANGAWFAGSRLDQTNISRDGGAREVNILFRIGILASLPAS